MEKGKKWYFESSIYYLGRSKQQFLGNYIIIYKLCSFMCTDYNYNKWLKKKKYKKKIKSGRYLFPFFFVFPNGRNTIWKNNTSSTTFCSFCLDLPTSSSSSVWRLVNFGLQAKSKIKRWRRILFWVIIPIKYLMNIKSLKKIY